MNETLKKHAPTAAIATVAVIAVKLMMPSDPIASQIAASGAVVGVAETPKQAADEPPTRLVSCGDMRAGSSAVATVVGDDKRGTVTLGDGANGNCTVLFSHRLSGKGCTIVGGRLAKFTVTDLVVTGAADRFTYACDERGGGARQ